MPSPRSISLIPNRADSFAGALQTDITKRWAPSPLDPKLDWQTSGSPRSIVGWSSPTESGHLQHFVTFEQQVTSDGAIFPPEEMLRLFCHVILSRLPARALNEARESLFAMIGFYGSSPEPARINDRRPVRASIVKSVQRAAITLDDE